MTHQQHSAFQNSVYNALYRFGDPLNWSADLNEATTTSGGMVFPPGHEDGECVGSIQKAAETAVAAVVTVTFDRADYLKRHLDSLLAVHGHSPDNG